MQIKAVACAVPRNVGRAIDYIPVFGKEAVDASIAGAGVRQWRYVSPGVCASDLCAAAAEALLDHVGLPRESIDLLVFVTNTPDYLIPATGPSIAHRLKLSGGIFSLDISSACSGFTDGLITASSLMKGMKYRRALLLCGYTSSKITDRTDKDSALLVGDAASATLLESDDEFDCVVSSTHGSFGSGAKTICQNVGYRHGLGWDADAIAPKDMALFHQGMGVFSFTYSRVLKAIGTLLEQSGWTIEQTDYFLLHQPHKFLLQCLAEKAGVPIEKVPIGLENFGNTSGASIPMLMVTELGEQTLAGRRKLVMIGFGAGLVWSGLCIESRSPVVLPLLEV